MRDEYSTIDADGDVFSELVPIDKNYDQVHLEVDLEPLVVVRRTRVDLREQHVQGHFQAGQHVSICHLNVLHLRGVCLVFEGFCPHELNLDRLDLQLCLVADQVALERICVAAVR